jgi:hypothetical protein
VSVASPAEGGCVHGNGVVLYMSVEFNVQSPEVRYATSQLAREQLFELSDCDTL